MCAWTEQGSAAMSMRQYEIPTGRVGLLTLWGGLFLQISTIVLLAGLSETSAQTVGTAVVGAAVGEVGDMVGATDGAGAEKQIVHPVRDTE